MTIIVETTSLLSEHDYTWLQAAVIDWSHRSDLASRVPTFIDLAERELFRELALRNIEASVSGTTSGDTIDIPDGLSAFERIEVEHGGHKYTLNYTSPNGIEALTGSTDRPSRYVVENGVIRLLAAPSGPYTYTIFYIPVLTPLADSGTTNWLLTNHSDLYLKATLLQAYRFIGKPDEVMRLGQEVGQALDAVKRADERKRFPIAGGLQIKPRSYR